LFASDLKTSNVLRIREMFLPLVSTKV